MDNNTIRLLAASGPLIQQNFPQGMPRPMLPPQMAAAAAAGMDQAAQFSQALRAQAMMCQNMNPEITPEMMANMQRTQFMMDPSQMGFHPYLGFDGGRRKNATREITQPLKNWLTEHKRNPYPTKPEKVLLAMLTGMSLTQVSTWFANARRRLKKENRMTWSPRNGRNDSDDDDDDDNNDTLDTSTELKTSTTDIKSNISSDIDSPKKNNNKIWSIADTLNQRSESVTSNNSNKIDDVDTKSTITTPNISGQQNNSTTINPLMMAAMNKILPPQMYAMIQQQQQQALQQQQLAAMLRSTNNNTSFNPMFLNNLFNLPGMNLPGPSSSTTTTINIPSTSSSSTSPNLDSSTGNDNSSSDVTTTQLQINTSNSNTTTDDRESLSPINSLSVSPKNDDNKTPTVKLSPTTNIETENKNEQI